MNRKRLKIVAAVGVLVAVISIFSLVRIMRQTSDAARSHISSDNLTGYYFDVYTADMMEQPRSGQLHYSDNDAPLGFTVANASQARQFAVQFFLDYQLTPIEIDGTVCETFLIDAGAGFSQDYTFDFAQKIDTTKNHKLLAILTAGSDISTAAVDFELSNHYSLAFDFTLLCEGANTLALHALPNQPADPVTEYDSAGLLVNIDTHGRSRAVAREVFASKGETLTLQIQANNTGQSEQAGVVLTCGLQQLSMNGEPMIAYSMAEGLISGIVEVTVPQTPGSYEIMAWLIPSPCEQTNDYLPLEAAYRFTLTVK